MRKANFVVLDCETGGLDHNENPITQIALMALDGVTLEEIKRYETFIKPYKSKPDKKGQKKDLKISKEALDATGLSMVDINNGLDYKVAKKLILQFMKSVKPGNHPSLKPVVVGHNVQFDTGFIDYLFGTCSDSIWNYISPTTVDTMVLTKMFNPKADSLRLGECCAEVGVDLPDAHKAMNDVVATADLFRVYCAKLKNASGGNVVKSKKEKTRTKFQF